MKNYSCGVCKKEVEVSDLNPNLLQAIKILELLNCKWGIPALITEGCEHCNPTEHRNAELN